MRHQDVRRIHEIGDGLVILHRVIRHLVVEQRREGVGVAAAHQHGVAIGLRFRHEFAGDQAIAAATIFIDDGLAQHLTQLERDGTCDHVRAAARCVGDEPTDGFGGVGASITLRACKACA